jgi:hypothetical protein
MLAWCNHSIRVHFNWLQCDLERYGLHACGESTALAYARNSHGVYCLKRTFRSYSLKAHAIVLHYLYA